jgi:hypothetical protein
MANGLCYSLQSGLVPQLAAAVGGRALPELPQWLAAMIENPLLIQLTG